MYRGKFSSLTFNVRGVFYGQFFKEDFMQDYKLQVANAISAAVDGQLSQDEILSKIEIPKHWIWVTMPSQLLSYLRY